MVYGAIHPQGFKDNDLGNSPGLWAAALTTYCPSRPSQLLATTVKYIVKDCMNRAVHVESVIVILARANAAYYNAYNHKIAGSSSALTSSCGSASGC